MCNHPIHRHCFTWDESVPCRGLACSGDVFDSLAFPDNTRLLFSLLNINTKFSLATVMFGTYKALVVAIQRRWNIPLKKQCDIRRTHQAHVLFVRFYSLRPNKQGSMCLVQGHNAVALVRLGLESSTRPLG